MRHRVLSISIAAVVLVLGAAFVYPLVATARDDQAFCLSCHVMADAGQSHASSYHKQEVTCSDCHTGSLVQKYTDGARHLVHNVVGGYSEPIALRESSKAVVTNQCAGCHNALSPHSKLKQAQGESCLNCHAGHISRPYSIQGLGD